MPKPYLDGAQVGDWDEVVARKGMARRVRCERGMRPRVPARRSKGCATLAPSAARVASEG